VQLARKRGDEQAAAHPDAPVDLPDREVDPDLLERFAPGDDMLVDAVDQCSIEVEQERRLAASLRIVCDASALEVLAVGHLNILLIDDGLGASP
jgi:hypothetical protein